MSRRHDLEHHRKSLQEIRDIMNSMKTLAYMETRKLSRFLDAQQAVVDSIERVASDFLGFYGEILSTDTKAQSVYILVGTERGFCGDINRTLLEQLETQLQLHEAVSPILIAVGHKLHLLMEEDSRVAAMIDGTSVAEDVTTLLNQLVQQLSVLQQQHGALDVYCLFHNGSNEVVSRRLLPPFQHLLDQPPGYNFEPELNTSPEAFLLELTDHYLFAALHSLLYSALMAENHHRITHLEGAVKHLDDVSIDLIRQGNALRQEEIIEEIEVILLSATSLDSNRI